MYTDEQLEELKETLREYNYYYGYADHPDGTSADPNTTFHTYEKQAQHDTALLDDLFMGFKTQNADALRQVVAESGQPRKTNFTFNESYPVQIDFKSIGIISLECQIEEPRK